MHVTIHFYIAWEREMQERVSFKFTVKTLEGLIKYANLYDNIRNTVLLNEI